MRSSSVYRNGFREKMPIREVEAGVGEKERRSSQLICASGCTLLALLQRALTGIAIKDPGDSCGMMKRSQGTEGVRRGNE